MAETIVACITPTGRSAVALIRLSGGTAWAIVEQMLQRFPKPPCAGQFFYSRIVDRGQIIDDVIVSFWQAPASYTGEEVVEIGTHGNPLIVQKIIELAILKGARFAGPGEFSQRAFTNGKMDLTQVESVIDIISASSEVALRAAHAMREGRLGVKIQEFKVFLIDLLAHLEAYIDFPDEDILPETGIQFQNRVKQLQGEVDLLLRTAPYGKAIREGIKTVIVGEPNVGKSTFLNLLLREKRAIVSALPGTTRDSIEVPYTLRGIPLILVDTAGQRETEDSIEQAGIERAQRWMEQADLVLFLVDVTRLDRSGLDQKRSKGQHWIKLGNKSDLGPSLQADAFPFSCYEPGAVEKIESFLSQQILQSMPSTTFSDFAINARQEGALRVAQEHLQQGLDSLQRGESPEYASIGLRGALEAFGDIVGLATHEDILDSLFKQFCIGK